MKNDEYAGKIAYVGAKTALRGPSGPVCRCVPVDEQQLPAGALAAWRAEFASVPEGPVYIGTGSEAANFDAEIALRLSRRPRVLFVRDNGAGDVIMSTPAVREFRKMYPRAHITYATLPANSKLLSGNPDVDDVISVHDPALFRRGWELIVNWSRAVEDYSVPRNRGPRIDSFAAMAGLRLEERKPVLVLSEEEREFARRYLAGRGERFVGYVMRAASWNRTWPLWRARELAAELTRRLPGHRMLLIDGDAECGFEAPGVVNACGATRSFREAAALLECCDVAITPDTGLAHACGALGVRTLVICGSIPPEARFDAYEDFHWIHPAGRVDCCPCLDWQDVWNEGPRAGERKTCEGTRINSCLESVTAAEIARRAADIAGGERRD